MTDCIEKTIELKAPVARVWRALTDHHEFGQWFRVRLEGEAVVQRMEPERVFSFTWHPYAIDPNQDYSGEPPTLVEFTLEKIAAGTRLRIVESGFDKLPAKRRDEAFRMNDRGWSIQTENIVRHVQQEP
jgi:uncharacterized protein YndB with AHSA1/START domain